MADLTPVLPGLIWAMPFLGIPAIARRTPDVALMPPESGTPLSIIIPARNESATIDTVLTSVLASSYHPLQVIVVDDRSTDDTADKVLVLAATDARVQLLRGEELPAGWLGKPWACHQGATAATGDLLLFTDADTRHAPTLHEHAVGALQLEQADLLTLTSRQQCLTFWERLVMPQIWMILAFRYTPAQINRATRPDQVVANGQFILVRRSTYEALGGHGAVRGQIVEDLAIAQHFIRNGRRLRMYFGETLLETRMYRSLAEMVEGWSKNLYLGARVSAPDNVVLRSLAPLGLLATFLFWLLPFGLLLSATTRTAGEVAIAASLLFWTLAVVGMRIPVWYALGYPLGACTALLIALRSIARGHRRVEWRGRRYRIDASGH